MAEGSRGKSSFSQQARGSSAIQARILTINVQNLEGDPRRQDILRDGTEQLDPDLVSLHEVIDTAGRHQLDELLAGTKLQGTHQSQTLTYAPPWADRYGGTAVATRWPHHVVETLDPASRRRYRCALVHVSDSGRGA
jgi:endonuclease/exonuclease/phosphatase family metal-dependent hydrolase